jgi:hypothetical protein
VRLLPEPTSPRPFKGGPTAIFECQTPSNADDFGERGFASLNSPARVSYTQRSTKKLRNGWRKSEKTHNLRCATEPNQRKFVGWERDNSRPIQPESVPPGAGPGCPCNCFTFISLVLPSRCSLIDPRRLKATWPRNTLTAKRRIVKETIYLEAVASLRRRIDVDDRAHVVMRDDGIARCPFDRSKSSKQLCAATSAGGHGYVLQPAYRAETETARTGKMPMW